MLVSVPVSVLIVSMVSMVSRGLLSGVVAVVMPLGWRPPVAPDLRWRQRNGQLLVVVGRGHGCRESQASSRLKWVQMEPSGCGSGVSRRLAVGCGPCRVYDWMRGSRRVALALGWGCHSLMGPTPAEPELEEFHAGPRPSRASQHHIIPLFRSAPGHSRVVRSPG